MKQKPKGITPLAKPKTKGLFDDFDEIEAMFASAIVEADNLTKPPSEQKPLPPKPYTRGAVSKAAMRPTPDCMTRGYDDFLHDRAKVQPLIDGGRATRTQITMEQWFDLLTSSVHYFNWQGLEQGGMIIGFAKTGASIDPLTAVLAVHFDMHASRSLSELAGELAGLSKDDAWQIGLVCWNDDTSILAKHGLSELRQRIVAAIRRGME